MSESIPSSIASFAHRRPRQDSTVSFTFLQQQDDTSEWLDEEAVEEVSSDDGVLEDQDAYPQSPDISARMKSSSRSSVEYPLLGRNGSTEAYTHMRRHGDRISQKLYIVTEDLTAVVTGFSTTVAGFIIYIALCLLSGGIIYLLLRWLPRWRVRIIGTPTPIGRCEWVAVEVRTILSSS
jgi:cation-transporting ATPase 13A2